MQKLIIAVLAPIIAILFAGCGSSGSSSSSSNNGINSFVVRIESTRVTPKFTTVQVNDTVQFLNGDTLTHQILSGTLDPQGSSLVTHLITIGNTGFSPMAVTAELGDTVRFSNNTMNLNAFTLDIVNDNGSVISSLTLAAGDSQVFSFPAAGVFTFRSQSDPLFKGTITLYGNPNSNGLFQSPIMRNGDLFTKQFTSRGTFTYYVLDQNNPNKSFITGTISVQ